MTGERDIESGPRVRFVLRSGNRKTGRIPVSMTDKTSCPTSCGLLNAGCYAEYGKVGLHWRKVPELGVSWPEFTRLVAQLPAGTLWRHNVAGDLPGEGGSIDANLLRALVRANAGRRGFTFTHKHKTAGDLQLVREATVAGFTVNLSAEDVVEADRLADLDVGPVVVLLPAGTRHPSRTAGGRKVVVCPAVASGLTCADCELCALPNRKSIVGFPVHGTGARLVAIGLKRRTRDSATHGSVRPPSAPLAAASATGEYLVPEDRAVAMIERCAVEIHEAQTVPDVQRVITQAEAIQAFLRKVRVSKEMRRAALALLVEAEQQLGRISRDLPHAARPRSKGSDMSRVEAYVIEHPGSSVGDVAVALGFAHRRASDLLYRCVARHQLVRAGVYGVPTFSPGSRGRQNLTRGKNEVLRENGINPARARFAEKLADAPEEAVRQAIDTVKHESVISVCASLGITKGFNERARTREYATADKRARDLSTLVKEGLDLLDRNVKTGEAPPVSAVEDARRRLAGLMSRGVHDE